MIEPAGPGLCRVPALAPCACAHQAHRHAAARAASGVLAVYTGADVARAKLGIIKCVVPMKNRDGSNYAIRAGRFWPRTACAMSARRWRWWWPRQLAEAKDAAELIEVDYEPLPAVVDPAEAVKPGAPLLFDAAPDNVALDWELGDAKAVEAAFAQGGADRDTRSLDQPHAW